MFDSPEPPALHADFQAAAYAAQLESLLAEPALG